MQTRPLRIEPATALKVTCSRLSQYFTYRRGVRDRGGLLLCRHVAVIYALLNRADFFDGEETGRGRGAGNGEVG